MTIYTIGHSNRLVKELLERLKTYEIDRLVDIRTKPYSRFYPWFNRNTLSSHLNRAGIAYDFRGNNLGGLGDNVDFDFYIEELVDLCSTERIVIMCSEADYKKCHRHTMIEPELIGRGVKVEHILYV